MYNDYINKVINDNFVMLKKAKNVFILLFIVTELSEALQKKAISLLTGGAVEHLQTGNKSLKGRLST